MCDTRRMRPVSVLLLAVLFHANADAAEAAPKIAESKIEAVTLYRGRALVTRNIPLVAGAGNIDLVVSNLPEQIVSDSLFAEGSAGVTVRAVRYRTRAVGEEPREAVRKIDADMEACEVKRARNSRMQELCAQRQAYLDKLENFSAPAAAAELSKGVLNADAIKGITSFDFEQRKLAAEESLTLATEARDLQRQLELLKKERAEMTSGSSKLVREALIFLDKQAADNGIVRLSYLVGNCGWSSSYNFRAQKDGKEFHAEYNAMIFQMSGEDWNGVALTLSTASPALSSEAPGLAPFKLALTRTNSDPNLKQDELLIQYKSSLSRRTEAGNEQQSAPNRADNFKGNWGMNTAANDIQLLEFVCGKDALSAFRETAQDVPSVNYQLAATTSLASRSDQQLVRISDMKLEGKMYHTACPVLTSNVYREAELTNTGEEVLLSGPAFAYLDGQFVGQSELPTVSRGETFVLGFGADGQLRARRELVDKTESVQGGNKEIAFKYRLVIENFKDTPVNVRVQDRAPVAEHEADVRVTLNDMQDKLSDDKLYLRVERPKGILRWEIEAPAKASGEKAKLVEFSYKLEFDRNLYVVSARGADPLQMQEFKQLQMERNKK